MSVPDDTQTKVPLKGLPSIRWALMALFLYLFFKLVLYPFMLSPVKHVPGPFFARVSKLPLQYAILTRRRTEYATQLLERYGSIVVIAPDQVHTTDDVAMKTIYDKTAIKTSFYSGMGSWKGVKATLAFLDYASAAPSRNNLIQCFQNKNLATLTENIQSHIEDFLKLLHRKFEMNEAVDGVVVFRLLALDIVTDVLWGEEDRLLQNYREDQTPVFLQRFQAFSTWNAVKSFIPGLDFFVRHFGNEKWRTLRSNCLDLDATAKEALCRWESTREHKRREKDVLSMLQSMNKGVISPVPVEDIPAYMVEMLAAGSSTISHTAAFACWSLTRDCGVQEKLRAELAEAFPDPDNIDIRQATELPFLDCVLRETMRMYPMIPGPGERHLGRDMMIAGKRIPKGIVASNSPFNQGRIEEVFPGPNSWKPERWLDANERMRLNWIPFGYGCRSCPGANLAMTELKYIIAMIFRTFKAVMPPNGEKDELGLADVFAAGSKTGHCWLKFVKLDEMS